MPVAPKTVLCIHDLPGFGRAGLAVIVPILSALGLQAVALPTAVLSTHTGGLGAPARLSSPGYGPAALAHYRRLGVRFDCIYSGYLSEPGQALLVEQAMEYWPVALKVVDPVMGDGGKLYQTYTPQMADGMARLCRRADIVVPNMTEACHLLGRPYNPGPYTQREIAEILQGLCAMGPKMAVLTGVWLQEGALGTACYDSQVGEAKLFLTDRIEGFYHGTGDLFASALLGGLLNGAPL